MTAKFAQRSATSLTMCVDRITTTSDAMSASRLWKRTRSSGSRPAVGSSTMTSFGLPSSACAMPKRWRMPPENPPSFCLRTWWRLTRCSSASTVSRARLRVDEALEAREVVEQLERRDLRIDAEVLRQVAQHRAHLRGLAQDVDVAERRLPVVRRSAAWPACASASTCRRRSARAGRTSRAQRRATRGRAPARRWRSAWTGCGFRAAWGLDEARWTIRTCRRPRRTPRPPEWVRQVLELDAAVHESGFTAGPSGGSRATAGGPTRRPARGRCRAA